VDETLVLNDASKEDAVIDVLSALDLTEVETRVEIALDYPSQQLAVDLWADSEAALTKAVETIKAALKQELDLDAPTSTELERLALAKQSA